MARPLPKKLPVLPRSTLAPTVLTATTAPPLKRQYPHVDNVTDWRAQQSLRLLWDRAFALEEALQGVITTQRDLIAAVNGLADDIATLRRVSGEALALAQQAAGGGEGSGGPSTIPDYSDIVDATIAEFVSMTCAIADNEKAKAQFTRWVAWNIYQVDPNIRLLKKTGGTQVNNRSVDKLIQGTDGSFADVCTDHDNGDGTCTINPLWIPQGPDDNTTQSENWIVPTLAIANEPGPLTRV